jgi:hypothetical protein
VSCFSGRVSPCCDGVLYWLYGEVVRVDDLPKMCRFDKSKRCFHSSCSLFDVNSGSVFCCPLFKGGDMFTPRIVKRVYVSIFSKHYKNRRLVVV